jgi:tRNA threonylcarbamoyladenosine biosynthesis protein TsaB
MHTLGIETATACQSVALIEDFKVLAEVACPAEGTRGGRLMPMIDMVFRKAGLEPPAVDLVAVSQGPGSFTGVRVGIATAQGLALGTGASVVGVSTLHALAMGHGITPGVICCLLHAGRGELYAGLFTWQQRELTRLRPDTLLTPEAVAEFAGIAGQEEMHLIGEGAGRYRERLMTAFDGRARFTEEGLKAVPTAVAVARLGGQLLKTGARCIEQVTPVYLRRAEAEVNWEKGLVKSPLERLAKTGH